MHVPRSLTAASTGGGGADGRRTPAASRGGVVAFADGLDVLLVALGTLGAVADGCSYNLLLAFISDVVNSLGRGARFTYDSCRREVRRMRRRPLPAGHAEARGRLLRLRCHLGDHRQTAASPKTRPSYRRSSPRRCVRRPTTPTSTSVLFSFYLNRKDTVSISKERKK